MEKSRDCTYDRQSVARCGIFRHDFTLADRYRVRYYNVLDMTNLKSTVCGVIHRIDQFNVYTFTVYSISVIQVLVVQLVLLSVPFHW